MLEKYRKKRNFNETAEPSGKEAPDTGQELVFMVHKHHASHLHYDLRLELDGVFKSWAVPKGPSMNPADKRLAMLVEDHPYEYKDYEGVIPEGEYGAGPTLIWDTGSYGPQENQGDKEANETKLKAGFHKGHMRFVLNGQKLRGRFDLVRIPDGKKENSWLLIKVDDEYANTEIPDGDRSVVSGLTIEELRAGVPPKKAKLVDLLENGAHGAMPRKVTPMLATLVDGPFDREGWIFEIKWDGYRAIAEVENGKTKLYSRNGLPFTEYGEVAEELSEYQDAVFDGEIVVVDRQGRSDFGALQNYARDQKGSLAYYVFDLLYYDGRILTELPLIERKEILREILRNSEHVKYADHIEEAGRRFFELAKQRDIEGIIGKNAQSKYEPGRRWPDWVKVKNVKTQEAIICGYTEPRGSRKGFGALILGIYDQGKLRYVGHTGGGFDERSITAMKDVLDMMRIDRCPFEKIPKTNEVPTWIEPKVVCQVKFVQWTKDGIMRQPVFLGIRDDKDPKEVTREPEKNVAELVEKTAKPKPIPKKDANGKVHLTHLDKVWFPEEGITKGDIVAYYERIAPFILPYLAGRPQTLVRHPNGIQGKGFYQKNIEDAPSWLRTQEVKSESEERTVNYAVICEDADSLLYLVNLGCIDLHPWSSRIHSLDRPDYVIFDFDPEDIGFSEVIRAASVTLDLLDEIGAPSYCKTSGATGIHVLVPTGAKYGYDQVTAFAKLINTVVHARLPSTTSLERMPKKRQKKVYLDYLQNRRGQTIASVYCVRPKPGAPVSTPLLREEISPQLNPLAFNTRTIFDRLERYGDLWKGMFEQEFDMLESIGKLERILT